MTFALERTLLAWTRTVLALMGFGFVVARLGLFLRELDPAAASPPGQSRWIGVALVGLGALVQVMALASHLRRVRELRSGVSIEPRVISPATLLGVGLVVVAAIVGVYLATFG